MRSEEGREIKREEKGRRTRSRILEAATEMFARQGYGGFRINAFCRVNHIAKGVFYHNFPGKDALYLACVEDCVRALSEYLAAEAPLRIADYLRLRFEFFARHPSRASLFFEALLFPPEGLAQELEAIQERRRLQNRRFLKALLAEAELREGVALEEALDYLDMMQKFINRHFLLSGRACAAEDGAALRAYIRDYERTMGRLLDYLIYGIAKAQK